MRDDRQVARRFDRNALLHLELCQGTRLDRWRRDWYGSSTPRSAGIQGGMFYGDARMGVSSEAATTVLIVKIMLVTFGNIAKRTIESFILDCGV